MSGRGRLAVHPARQNLPLPFRSRTNESSCLGRLVERLKNPDAMDWRVEVAS